MIMIQCSLELEVLTDGNIAVNFTDCSDAEDHLRNHGNQTSRTGAASGTEKDDFGAMQYTIAVVVLYGIAMMGVFGMGQFRRRKRHSDAIDHETNIFLKNYDEVRRTWERQSRVGVISSLLHQLHNQPVMDNYHSRSRPSVNSLAFLPITLSINSSLEKETGDDVELATYALVEDHVIAADDIELDETDELMESEHGKQSRVSLLGSSRRSMKKYRTCRQCMAIHGVSVSRNECSCRRSVSVSFKHTDGTYETDIDGNKNGDILL